MSGLEDLGQQQKAQDTNNAIQNGIKNLAPRAMWQIKEKLIGWYKQDEGEEIKLSVEAKLTDDLEITATGVDRAGQEFELCFGRMHDEWIPVEFPSFVPFCPIKLDRVILNTQTTIEKGAGKTQGGAQNDKFKLRPEADFQAESECDACGYPGEKSFKMDVVAASFEKRGIEVSLTGLCRLTPFSTRIYAVYTEKRISVTGDPTMNTLLASRRVIFEKKITAELSLSPAQDAFDSEEVSVDLENASALLEFQVEIFKGKLKERGLFQLESVKGPKERSKLIEDAHKIVKSDSGEIFVLQGSLQDCNEAILDG